MMDSNTILHIFNDNNSRLCLHVPLIIQTSFIYISIDKIYLCFFCFRSKNKKTQINKNEPKYDWNLMQDQANYKYKYAVVNGVHFKFAQTQIKTSVYPFVHKKKRRQKRFCK